MRLLIFYSSLVLIISYVICRNKYILKKKKKTWKCDYKSSQMHRPTFLSFCNDSESQNMKRFSRG